jgi:hypothetical protein
MLRPKTQKGSSIAEANPTAPSFQIPPGNGLAVTIYLSHQRHKKGHHYGYWPAGNYYRSGRQKR